MADSYNCVDCKIGSHCFKKLFPEELDFINQKKTQISYNKGENICKQGAFASYVLYISEGLVKLYVENNGKKFTTIQLLKNGEFIGLSSIYGENIYNYSALALTDVNVCLIEKEAVKKLMEKNAAFASSVIQRYCINERNLFDKIKSISYKQMPGRLADAILYLAAFDYQGGSVFPYLNRKDIADFATISKESTVKLLTAFKNEGLIDLSGKEIQIKRQADLEGISLRG